MLIGIEIWLRMIMDQIKGFKSSDSNVALRITQALKQKWNGRDVDAAVVLLLQHVGDDLKVFLVERVESSADPWSGQMALPGGKREVEDRNLRETGIRELLEETNIDVLDRCRFLGVMDALRSTQRPELKVLPFVVLLEHEPLIKLSSELKRYVWISVSTLIQCRGSFKSNSGEVPAYIVGKNIIWGLTYRILENFIHALDARGHSQIESSS